MNFAQHFLDETHGSGYPEDGTQIVEQGNYLCIQTPEHPVYVYQLVHNGNVPHPSIARVNHNGRMYTLAWIEDDKW